MKGFKEVAAIVFGTGFILFVFIGLCTLLESQRKDRQQRLDEEKQRIEQMEEENRLLKAKCGCWRMEQVE